jgi:hypothetical protein
MVPGLELGHVRTCLQNLPGAFMAEHDRDVHRGGTCFVDVQIRVADARGVHPDQDLVPGRACDGQVFDAKGYPGLG